MKANLFRMLRSTVALLLVFCMVAGFVPTAVFAEEAPAKKYVSLGDSMTNGLGLGGGYDSTGHQGYLEIDKYAYPALLAKDYGWDLTQLATSAMRAEDLHFALDYGTEGAYAGDEWTQRDLLNNGRWGKDAAKVAKVFQESVAEADVVTMAVGNANFGVYMMDMTTSALGIPGYGYNYSFATLENALKMAEADAEAKELVMGIYNKLKAYLGASVPTELLDTLVGQMTYVVTSYVLNYAGALDRIVELNPDVELIIVGLMNTMSGFEMDVTFQGATHHIDMAAILDLILDPMNAYLAALPAVKQTIGSYAEAKIYYAELDRIETLAVTYKDEYAANEAFYLSRFVGDITGFVFPMMGLPVLDHTLVAQYRANVKAAGGFDNYCLALGAPYAEEFIAQNGAALAGQGKTEAEITALAMEYATAKVTPQVAPFEAYNLVESAILNAMDKTPNINLDELAGLALPSGTEPGAMAFLAALLGEKLFNEDGSLNAEALETDGTIVALLSLYGRLKLGQGMSAHPSKKAHNDLYETIKASYDGNHTAADQTKDNLLVVAKAAADLIAEYYDDAYAYAYAEAAQVGYISDATEGIQAVIDALAAIDLSGTEMTDAFKAEVAGEIEEIIEALAAAKALIAEADVLDNATYTALLAMLDEAGEAIENLQNVLAQAGADVNDLVVTPALNAAKDKLLNEVLPSIKENLKLAVQAGTEFLMEKLGDAYDALVEALVEAAETAKNTVEQLPDWVYNWLYNNPEKVIGFFNEYGDEMVAFLDEYKEEAAMVLGYILVNYGEDIAAFVMENADEVLKTMVEWFEEHGENTWALIKVYLEELGVIDAIKDAVDNAGNALKDELKALKDLLCTILPALKGQGEEYLKDLLKQVNALIDAVKEQLKTAEGIAKEKLEAILKAAETLKAAVEQAIKDGIAAVEQLKAAAEALEKAIKDAADCLNNRITEEYNKIVNTIKELLDFSDELNELLGYVDQLLELVKEQLAAAEGAAKAQLENLYNKLVALKDLVEQMIADGSNALKDKLIQAVLDVIQAAQDAAEALGTQVANQIEALINKIIAVLTDLYEGATHDNYFVNEDSYYVAIGDGTAVSQSYVDALAAELGVAYKNLSKSGMMVADIFALLEAEKAEVEKADLITIGFGNNTFVNYAVDNIGAGLFAGVNVEHDWASVVSEQGVSYVEEALTAIYEKFAAQNLGTVELLPGKAVDLAQLMTAAVESYAFAAASYAVELPEAVNEIHAINEDAVVVIVGMYNPAEDVVIKIGEEEFDIGEYVDYLVTAANVHNFAYALLTDNAIFVQAEDVQTNNSKTVLTVEEFLMQYLNIYGEQAGEAFNPSAEGHEYIKTQIYNALTLLNPVEIEFSRMILGNELAMQFAFKQAPIIDGVDYAVSITKTYADGRGDKTVVIPQSQWKTTTVNGQPYYYVSFNGIAAKEMGDDIYVQVIAGGDIAVSEVYTDSIRAYALEQLRKTDVAETQTLYVDMLNYGAAAQTYFEYDAADPVNADLTDAEKAYGTETVELENKLVAGENYVASQLNLASSIQLRVKFNNIDASMKAVVSFTNHVGREIEVEIDGSEFLYEGTVVVVNNIVAADYEQDVTITVYNANGEAVAGAVDSVASYIARMSGENAPVIYDAVAKYTAAAYAYLHK